MTYNLFVLNDNPSHKTWNVTFGIVLAIILTVGWLTEKLSREKSVGHYSQMSSFCLFIILVVGTAWEMGME